MKPLILKEKIPIDFALENNYIYNMWRNTSKESVVELKQREARISKVNRIFKDQSRNIKTAKDDQLWSKKREGMLYIQMHFKNKMAKILMLKAIDLTNQKKFFFISIKDAILKDLKATLYFNWRD